MKSFPWIILLILVLLLSRVPLILNSLDFYSGDPETVWQSRLARDVLDGKLRYESIWEYRCNEWLGGPLIQAFLLVPLFLVFGGSFFPLFILTILWSSLILVVIYFFLRKFFSPLVGVLGSFLFIFAPVEFVNKQMLCKSIHFNLILLVLLVFFLFYAIFFSGNKTRVPMRLFSLLGLVCGFALFFDLTFLIALVNCLIFWFIIDRRFFLKKEFFFFSLFFILGFSPWIFFNLNVEFAGTSIASVPLRDCFFGKSITEHFGIFYKTLTYDLREFLAIGSIPIANLGSFIGQRPYIKYILFYLSMSAIFWIFLEGLVLRRISGVSNFIWPVDGVSRKDYILRQYFLIIFTLIYLFAYSIFIWQERRYLVSLQPIFFFLVAILVNKFIDFTRNIKIVLCRKVLTTALISAVVLIGILNYLSYLFPFRIENFNGNIFRYRGYGTFIPVRFSTTERTYVARLNKSYLLTDLAIAWYYWLDNLPKEVGSRNLSNLFVNSTYRGEAFGRQSIKRQINITEQIQGEFKRSLLYLLLGLRIGEKFSDDLAYAGRLIDNNIDEQYKSPAYEGLAIAFLETPFPELRRIWKQVEFIPQAYRHYFWVKLGERIGERYAGEALVEVAKFTPLEISPTEKHIAKFLTGFTQESDAAELTWAYQGLLSGLPADSQEEILSALADANQKTDWRRFYYQRLGFNRSLFNEDNCDLKLLEEIPSGYRVFFLQGALEQWMVYNLNNTSTNFIFQEETQDKIVSKIKEILDFANNELYQAELFKAVGFQLSLRYFGHVKNFTKLKDLLIKLDNSGNFYYGYGLGLGLRYQRDYQRVSDLIRDNVPLEYKNEAHNGLHVMVDTL